LMLSINVWRQEALASLMYQQLLPSFQG